MKSLDRVDSLSFIPKGGEQIQACCAKCRAKKEMKDAKSIAMKNGRTGNPRYIPNGGSKTFRIGKG